MKRNKKKYETLIIKPSNKYKMDEDEVQMFLHMKRKGSHIGKDKSKFVRKPKHKSELDL